MSNMTTSFLYVLLKNRKFVIRTLLIVMAITIGITYLLPKSYTVKTVILPPEEPASPGLSIGGLSLGEFAGFFSGGMGYSLPLMTTLSDVYVEILNSRTLIDNVIISTGYADSVGITEEWGDRPEVAMYRARITFMKNYSARVGSAGMINVDVTTKNPLYSIEVAERVVFLLDSINTSITRTRFEESRILTENQLAVARAALEGTTARLLSFEDEYGTIMPEEEIAELMSVLAEMKGRYIETTLMANAIRNGIRYGTTAQILELETEAQALSEAITMIESGTGTGGVDIGPGLSNLPPALVEYARLRTDFEMHLKMVSALELQVAQASVQEDNIVSSIRILDPPRHPGWKSKPKRLYIWVETFIIAFLMICAFLFARERAEDLKREHPETWEKWNSLLKEIGDDFRIRGKKKKG